MASLQLYYNSINTTPLGIFSLNSTHLHDQTNNMSTLTETTGLYVSSLLFKLDIIIRNSISISRINYSIPVGILAFAVFQMYAVLQ